MITFEQLDLSHRDLFGKYISGKNIGLSYYNFTCMFMWRKLLDTKFAIVDDFLCVVGKYMRYPPFLFMPLGNGDISKPIEKIFENFNNEIVLRPLPKDMVNTLSTAMPNKFEFTEIRNSFDYIYLVSDLVELSGKKYHAKRNHINKFKSLYEYEYLPLDNTLINECLEVQKKWCKKHECEENSSLEFENNAIIEVLSNYDKLDYKGGVLTVGGEIIAFTIGEQITTDMALIHVEKANTDFNGSYAMINQLFAGHEWQHLKFINREEDMGIEGLRKAKLSYYPYMFGEVYNATYIG